MPLNLHEDCKTRLVQLLAEVLPNIKVKNGVFFDVTSLLPLFEADEVIPKGSVREQLVNYIDDYPIITFVHDTLITELFERAEYSSDALLLELTKIEGFDDPSALAQSLVDRLESLPWKYTLSLKLPTEVSALFSTFITDFALSSKIRIVHPGGDFAERFPLKSEDEKRNKRIYGEGTILVPFAAEDLEWEGDATYLQIETEGFIGPYGDSIPAMDAGRVLKAVCGLGIALQLFHTGYMSYSPSVGQNQG